MVVPLIQKMTFEWTKSPFLTHYESCYYLCSELSSIRNVHDTQGGAHLASAASAFAPQLFLRRPEI